MSTPYRAVLFDLGGTLFSYRDVVTRSVPVLLDCAKRLDVSAEPGELGQAFAIGTQDAYAVYGERPFYLHRDLFFHTYRKFADELGTEASDDFCEWAYESMRTVLTEQMNLRQGCLETLRALRDRGLYLSIVSNIDNDHLIPMVANLGLDDVMHHWTSSEDARSCKPDLAFFEIALDKAGCRADETLFVGDSREHDIQGARAAGMTSVLLIEKEAGPDLPAFPAEVEPHHEIRELAELLDLVD